MKNTMKKTLGLMLALLMLMSVLSMGVSASERWDVINNKGVSGDDIVAQARTYLGVPYDTSGGNYKYRTGFGDTMMFDCSGFVYRVCRDVGLASSHRNSNMGMSDPNGKPLEGQDDNGNYFLTADTRYQRYYGLDISSSVQKYIETGDYSELKAGDLLFITNNNSWVTHVVIYEGNGNIIHSEGAQGCVAEHNIDRYHINKNNSNWYFAACRLVEDEFQTGDIIKFGSYPQTEEKAPAIIEALNALAPEWDEWKSYGYYSGNGNIDSMKQGDWMRYVDIPYDGEIYRGVKFTQYRPGKTYQQSSYLCQLANGYRIKTIYWFKFEPIDWRVLDPSTGLVMCETIIDSQPYSNTMYYNSNVSDSTYAYFNDSSYTNYASDYETSSIRQWLNTDFYNTAFSSAQQKIVKSTTLNNDGYYTSNGTTGVEKLDSNSTNDKIFLLSYNEVRNSNFGFDSDQYEYDKARQAQGSNYAQSQGLDVHFNNNSNWFLRSPAFSDRCCGVGYEGYSSHGYYVDDSAIGVRPAFCLDMDKYNSLPQTPNTPTEPTPCKHPNANNVPQLDPNCIDIGFTAGTYCNDCATWLSGHEVIAVGTHKDSNGDSVCDTCLVELSKPGGTEVEKKNFIEKVVDAIKTAVNNIVNFFRRIIGI